MICPFYPTPTFLFIAEGVSPLIYYSHLSSILITFVVTLFVFISNWKRTENRILFSIGITYILLTFGLLITWTNNRPDLIMTAWSYYGLLYTLICIQFYYFFYYFVNGKFPSLRKNLFFVTLLTPAILLTPTDFNLEGFDLIGCAATENFSFIVYYHSVAVIVFSTIIYEWFFLYRKKFTGDEQKMNRILVLGILLFLLIFFTNSFIASYLVNSGYMTEYTIEQYALFGMTFFMVLISYLIVRYQAFEVKLIAAQALVVGLILTTLSIFLFLDSKTAFVLNCLSLLLVLIGGYFIVKSVKQEIKQREQIEKLAVNLEKANKRLREIDKQKSEFVSIASHQLRSPLTAIRGYASMLAEGSFGSVSPKMTEPINRIQDSARMMAESIEDFLSVSRIEAGNMKYEYSDFNIRDRAERIVDDLRPEGFKKGLLLLYKQQIESTGVVHADMGKTEQILHNLVNNSLKYTPKGTITVFVHDDVKARKIFVEIMDTGIGMSQETIDSLFEKFTRAKNANTVNIKGTGLGLFVAREMARAMSGDITAHSEGEGKGSRFVLTMPLVL